MSTPYFGFYEASVPSSVTTSISAAARAAHSASRSTSTARVVNSERRNQTTLCFPQRPQPDAQRNDRGEQGFVHRRWQEGPEQRRRRTRTLSSSSPRSRSRFRRLLGASIESLPSPGRGSHLRTERSALSKLSGGSGDGSCSAFTSRYPRQRHSRPVNHCGQCSLVPYVLYRQERTQFGKV